jgi:3-hydroxymyristoyl/3-hydroxydecanoyl-(acyl carrier protein) dehydratase
VISHSENRNTLEIVFSPESGIFEGHFPSFPLVPGVMQIQLAIRLFEQYQEKKISFAGLKNLKFFNPIFPGATVILECHYELEKKQLSFQYTDLKRTFSKGQIVVKDV